MNGLVFEVFAVALPSGERVLHMCCASDIRLLQLTYLSLFFLVRVAESINVALLTKASVNGALRQT